VAVDETLRIVFLGPPGSGKGTQAERLSSEFGVPAISTGEMLRAAVAAGDELGQRVEGVMSRGELVDDVLMAEVVKKRLSEPDAARGFLLDGYPRTASQADTLDEILAGRDQELDHVLFIDVPEERLVERALLRQRDDDREDVVRERLRVYREKTEPLVERYRQTGLLRQIDGDQSIEQVGLSIRSVIG
jgi:adenylate kinase